MAKEGPKVIAFACTWVLRKALSDVEPKIRTLPNIAMELEYYPDPKDLAEKVGVPVVRLQCTGRFEIHHAVMASLQGADAVIVFACPPGLCSYHKGNEMAWKRAEAFNKVLEEMGINKPLVKVVWVTAERQEEVLNLIREEVRKAKEEVLHVKA